MNVLQIQTYLLPKSSASTINVSFPLVLTSQNLTLESWRLRLPSNVNLRLVEYVVLSPSCNESGFPDGQEQRGVSKFPSFALVLDFYIGKVPKIGL